MSVTHLQRLSTSFFFYSGDRALRSSLAGHEWYFQRDQSLSRAAGPEPSPTAAPPFPSAHLTAPAPAAATSVGYDAMREWFKPLKRVDRAAGATARPPPFHVDSLKELLQAASQGRLRAAATPQHQHQHQHQPHAHPHPQAHADPHLRPQAYSRPAAAAPGPGRPGLRSLGRDGASTGFDPRLSLDAGLARISRQAYADPAAGAFGEEKNGTQDRFDVDTGGSGGTSHRASGVPTSLLRTLQEVADDASYDAHWGESARGARQAGGRGGQGGRGDPNTPAEETKTAHGRGSRGQAPQLADTGHLASGVSTQAAAAGGQRVHKLLTRDTNRCALCRPYLGPV